MRLLGFKKNTLFQQILIAGISPALIVFISLFTYSLITRLNDAAFSQKEIAIRIAENIAASSELAIISGNNSQLIEIMKSALIREISSITVNNFISKDNVSVEKNILGEFNTVTIPIYQSNIEISDSFTGEKTSVLGPRNKIGEVIIKQSKNTLLKLQRKIILVSSLIGVLSIIICIYVAWIISRRLSQPLAEIKNFTKNIASGELGERINVIEQGEMGDLQKNINEMAQSLEKQQHEITNRLEQLQLAKTEADEANKAKGLFLATMTHELRTPLNGALGMLQLLTTTPLSEEQSKYINIATHSSEHLLNIVNNILDYSNIEKGDIKLDRQLFSPSSLFEMSLTPLALESKSKGVDFNYKIADELQSINIYGDSTRIRQIILNLTANAVKFTHTGSIDITLNGKKLNDENIQITLTVADTGVGIKETDHKIIFDSFRQVDGSNQRRYSGSGLGLAIVKRLCELKNADITMESSLGKGTTFTVRWICRYESKQLPVNNTEEQKNILVGKKVLIVEDNPINQMLVASIVKRWGMLAITANNGEECLTELQNQNVDIILMDLQMPIMDGYEASVQIRANKKYSTIPIIALTANNIQEDKKRCFSVGMNDFLSKPVSLNILKEKMSYYLY